MLRPFSFFDQTASTNLAAAKVSWSACNLLANQGSISNLQSRPRPPRLLGSMSLQIAAVNLIYLFIKGLSCKAKKTF